ncbi:hypothetical protein EDD85DRAFT_783227 [Armillaria nabsnona]|nr:hypothetical protein EDD85DRAFT_783227 [Armillaria nabsnona]
MLVVPSSLTALKHQNSGWGQYWIAKESWIPFAPPRTLTVPSTPARWRAYAGNRAAADKKRLRDRKAEKPGYESPESDGDEWDVFNDSIYFLCSIRRTMRELEGELQLPSQSPQKGCKVLWCNAAFEESYNPRTVDAMARLYSLCTPTYIDGHLQYHSRMRYYEVEWYISVGYKIYTTRIPNTPANTVPADLDLKMLKEDVNALFGPLPDLQHDDKEGQVKRQEELIRTVRVVLAAVGMDYEISTKDNIPDKQSLILGLLKSNNKYEGCFTEVSSSDTTADTAGGFGPQ